MHTLMFLDPGHFHAALVLRERHALVADEIIVYAREERADTRGGSELAEFLSLVEAFNRRAERPTGWRPTVRTGDGALVRLLDERPGDAVVLAGKNDGKMATIRHLHDAGLHVLADKPWITRPDALPDVRHALGGGAIVMEMLTGRHEITSIVAARLVREPDVFGGFEAGRGEPSIRLASVHHLEKLVNGAPLRRPSWFFDVRVQGDGLADIPTHLVAEAQRLLAAHGRPTTLTPALSLGGRGSEVDCSTDRHAELISAHCWPTPVPRALFRRVTGLDDFPDDLRAHVDGDALPYLGNAELSFRLRGIVVEIVTRWDLSAPPGGGDTYDAAIVGAGARVRIEQGPHTRFRRRLLVEPRREGSRVGDALAKAVAAWQADFPGVAVATAPQGFEIDIPAALRTGHESHFPLALDEFLRAVDRQRIDRGRRPDAHAADTVAKYDLLARALASARYA